MKKSQQDRLENKIITNMSTFTEFETAVNDKRITYKEMVEMMYGCAGTRDAIKKLFDQLAIAEDDPKVLRKKHRDAQVEKFGDDKEAIKTAMAEYDATIRAKAPPGEAKPKPKPPIRVWSDEEKVYTKAKNAYVKSKEKEYGDDVTVADLKVFRKKWRKEYDEEHKDKKDEVNEEEESEPVEEEEPEVNEEETAEDSEAGPFAYYEEDNPEDLERERQEDEREAEEEEPEPVVEPVKTKPKLTKEQVARYKVLQKVKANQTEVEKAEYKALKKIATA